MGKATKVEVARRVEAVMQLRMLGKTTTEISHFMAEQGWHVSLRQVARYGQQADELLVETLKESRERMLYRHLGQRRTLYGIAMKQNDVKTALAVLRDEAELLGLYAPKRTELSGTDGGPIQMETTVLDDEQRRAAILAILAAAGDRPACIGHNERSGSDVMDTTGNRDEPSQYDSGSMADYVTPIV